MGVLDAIFLRAPGVLAKGLRGRMAGEELARKRAMETAAEDRASQGLGLQQRQMAMEESLLEPRRSLLGAQTERALRPPPSPLPRNLDRLSPAGQVATTALEEEIQKIRAKHRRPLKGPAPPGLSQKQAFIGQIVDAVGDTAPDPVSAALHVVEQDPTLLAEAQRLRLTRFDWNAERGRRARKKQGFSINFTPAPPEE